MHSGLRGRQFHQTHQIGALYAYRKLLLGRTWVPPCFSLFHPTNFALELSDKQTGLRTGLSFDGVPVFDRSGSDQTPAPVWSTGSPGAGEFSCRSDFFKATHVVLADGE